LRRGKSGSVLGFLSSQVRGSGLFGAGATEDEIKVWPLVTLCLGLSHSISFFFVYIFPSGFPQFSFYFDLIFFSCVISLSTPIPMICMYIYI
jgi:hypothetical protein